jgi:FkbM family methyltransferase
MSSTLQSATKDLPRSFTDDTAGWMEHLARASSSEALIEALAERYPALQHGRLRRLAILGAAEEGARLAALCKQLDIDIVLIADDNPERQGQMLEGVSVVPTAGLEECDRRLPVIIASHRVLGATRRLKAMGFDIVAPFATLQILAPERFPPHMFYDGLIEDLFRNRARYFELHDTLGDDISRRVLNAVVGFRLTMDPTELEPMLDDELYGPACIMPFGAEETYVDGGSFDGDSLRMFIERVEGHYERIYAYEPDRQTYARLCRNFAEEPRVVPVPKGLFREVTTLRFDDAGTRGSLFTDSGSVSIPVTTIDNDLEGRPATFIKMNIEGAEIDALEGAMHTIQSFAPKLAISAYHRPSDLWKVPATIKALRDDYQLFLRQQDGGIIETVCYAKRKAD